MRKDRDRELERQLMTMKAKEPERNDTGEKGLEAQWEAQMCVTSGSLCSASHKLPSFQWKGVYELWSWKLSGKKNPKHQKKLIEK